MRKPITETEMGVYLSEQIAALDDLTRPTWKRFRVPLRAVGCEGEAAGGQQSVFVVAGAGDEVLLYDDALQEFGVGRLEPDGVLRKWVTYGQEMRFALRHFPRKTRS